MGYYSTYYAFGFPSFLVAIVALYLLFTGYIQFQSSLLLIRHVSQTLAKLSTSVVF